MNEMSFGSNNQEHAKQGYIRQLRKSVSLGGPFLGVVPFSKGDGGLESKVA